MHSPIGRSFSTDEEEGDSKPASRLTAHFIASYSFASRSEQGGSGATNSSQALRRSPRQVKLQPKLEKLGARSAVPPTWSSAPSLKPSPPKTAKGKRKAEDDQGHTSEGETMEELKMEAKEEPPQPDPVELPNLNDHLREDIDVMFVGINPGIRSSQTGHHFAHPSNHFYKALHLSGFTSERVPPSLDHTLLNNEPLSLGLTNLCSRPSRNASFLTREEKEAGSPILVAKMRRYRPSVAAFVGKGIGEDFAKCVKAKTRGSIVVRVPVETPVGALGLQRFAVAWDAVSPAVGAEEKPIKKEEEDVEDSHHAEQNPAPRATLIFVMPSTSGLVTSHRISDKADCFAQARRLTEWLKTGNDEGASEAGTKEIELALINFAEDEMMDKRA